MKLLIVDDSMILRAHLKQALKQFNLEIVGEAVNGIEALDHFRKQQPDLVTMDITMPEMDGLTCTREMLKLNPDVKIIIISALSSADVAIQAVAAGAKDFIRKPFEPAELERAVQSILCRD
ncbi:MAG: response regulator [bacterium]|nr:response regulator [bacterium]